MHVAISVRVDGGGIITPVTPLAIMGANTVAWWRSDLGVTIGTGVATWADQSGNGLDLTQGTGANQPAYNATGGPNNTPSLLFDGTNDSLVNAAFDRPAPTAGTPTFVWAVGRHITWTAGDRFWSFGSVNGFAVHQLTATPGIAVRNNSASSVNSALALNTYGRIEAYVSNQTSDYLKLIATSVTGVALGSADPAAGFTLGAGQGQTNFGNVELCEVIVFNVLPSAGQIAQLDSYCTVRYGSGLV